MQTHYFRARIDQMVAGMNDTAVVAADAHSFTEAAETALKQHLGQDDFYTFAEGMWTDARGEDATRPSTGPVHYLGTHEDVMEEADGIVMLSELEGEKVTVEDFE